jgi:hypothetical protein
MTKEAKTLAGQHTGQTVPTLKSQKSLRIFLALFSAPPSLHQSDMVIVDVGTYSNPHAGHGHAFPISAMTAQCCRRRRSNRL